MAFVAATHRAKEQRLDGLTLHFEQGRSHVTRLANSALGRFVRALPVNRRLTRSAVRD
jgi:hypothetical protein